MEKPTKKCTVCRDDKPESVGFVSNPETFRRHKICQKASGGQVCAPCWQELKKIQKEDASGSVLWLKTIHSDSQKSIFANNTLSLLDDAKELKRIQERKISKIIKDLERETKALDFISSATRETERAYAEHLWSTYSERRKRANTAIRAGELRLMVFHRDGFQCVKCKSPKKLTIDHITPVINGGHDDLENLQTLCRKCNCSKGSKTMEEWS